MRELIGIILVDVAVPNLIVARTLAQNVTEMPVEPKGKSRPALI